MKAALAWCWALVSTLVPADALHIGFEHERRPQPRSCLPSVVAYKQKKNVTAICGRAVASRVTEELPLSGPSMRDCPVFYLHIEGYGRQSPERSANVRAMQALDPSLRVMKPIYWRTDFELLKKSFAALRLPFCFWDYQECGRAMKQGPLARFATAIFAALYQQRFNMSCMVTVEDDVSLPPDFRQRFDRVHMPEGMPMIYKFGELGEGYALNLEGAKEFINRVYKYGLVRAHDMFVIDMCKDMKWNVDVGAKLLVGTNSGDIISDDVQEPDASEFDYEGSSDARCAQVGVDAFSNENETDLAAVMARLATSQTSCSL